MIFFVVMHAVQCCCDSEQLSEFSAIIANIWFLIQCHGCYGLRGTNGFRLLPAISLNLLTN